MNRNQLPRTPACVPHPEKLHADHRIDAHFALTMTFMPSNEHKRQPQYVNITNNPAFIYFKP